MHLPGIGGSFEAPTDELEDITLFFGKVFECEISETPVFGSDGSWHSDILAFFIL